MWVNPPVIEATANGAVIVPESEGRFDLSPVHTTISGPPHTTASRRILGAERAAVEDLVRRPVPAGIELHLVNSSNRCFGVGPIAHRGAPVTRVPDEAKCRAAVHRFEQAERRARRRRICSSTAGNGANASHPA
jgi:hypothetical protein